MSRKGNPRRGQYAEQILACRIRRQPAWWRALLDILGGYKGARLKNAEVVGGRLRKIDVWASFMDDRYSAIGISVKSFTAGYNHLERRNLAEFCRRNQIARCDHEFLTELWLGKARNPKGKLVEGAEAQARVKRIFGPIAPGIQALLGNDQPQVLALHDDARGLWHFYLTHEVTRHLRGAITFTARGNIAIGDYIVIQRKGAEGPSVGSSATDINHPSNNVQVKMRVKKFFDNVAPAASFSMEQLTRNKLTELHDFWYGKNYKNWPDEEQLKNWFRGTKDFDKQIQENFSCFPRYMREREEDFDACLADPVTATGLILCFDQLPRNIFRRQAKAFAYDDIAIKLAEQVSGSELFGRLTPSQKLFALMPYQHVEDRELQDKSVELFEAFAKEAPAAQQELSQGMADYARKHRDLVARFGRFPHRNEVLGRESTAEELRYLAEGGERFGQ